MLEVLLISLLMLAIGAALIAIPIWGGRWILSWLGGASIDDASKKATQFSFGIVVSVVSGFAMMGNEFVNMLGSVGDVFMQFPNLIAYFVTTILGTFGLSQLSPLDLGFSLLLVGATVLVAIMIFE